MVFRVNVPFSGCRIQKRRTLPPVESAPKTLEIGHFFMYNYQHEKTAKAPGLPGESVNDMNQLKSIIAENISMLRRAGGITQAELAEKLCYSDKAVSKWERGESVPDIAVLKAIADLFGVTVDYLITKEHAPAVPEAEEAPEAAPAANADTDTEDILIKNKKYNRNIITRMGILLVWLVATIVFVVLRSFVEDMAWSVFPFVLAIPVSCIVWLVFNSIWFNPRRNFAIISLMMWSVFFTMFYLFYNFGIELSLMFIIGIPGQAIILLWSRIRTKDQEPKKQNEKKDSES